MIKERPILFSGEMVKAILDGGKTQTRRVVKPMRGYEHNNILKYGMPWAADPWAVWWHSDETDRVGCLQECPYGKLSDRLWVRETFLDAEDYPCHPYHEDEAGRWDYRADVPTEIAKTITWKPSIFMPREASRITLEITNVRVERLQDISEVDAEAEGIEFPIFTGFVSTGMKPDYRTSFHALWDKINGKRAPWSSNPFVWVLEFQKL